MVFWPMGEMPGVIPEFVKDMGKRDRWDAYFIGMCRYVATMSKDQSTKVGSVIIGADREVLSTGFNGIPRYCDDRRQDRHNRPKKYFWFEHAERNAIFQAAKNGVRLDGATLYCSAPSCAECARAIIQSGIRRVIFPKKHEFLNREDWADNFHASQEMLTEAQIKVRWHESPGEDPA